MPRLSQDQDIETRCPNDRQSQPFEEESLRASGQPVPLQSSKQIQTQGRRQNRSALINTPPLVLAAVVFELFLEAFDQAAFHVSRILFIEPRPVGLE